MATKTENLTAAQKRLLAYAHPLREKIFTILTERVASPAQMTRDMGLPREQISNVDYHTKKLVEFDCAEPVGERKAGSLTETLYKATDRALVETSEWEKLARDNPAFAEYQLGRAFQVQFDDGLLAFRAGTIGEDSAFHLTRTRRILDAEGYAAALELKERSLREMDEIEKQSAERRSESGNDAIIVSDNLALFKVPSPSRDEISARNV